jgi:hypothetical protein
MGTLPLVSHVIGVLLSRLVLAVIVCNSLLRHGSEIGGMPGRPLSAATKLLWHYERFCTDAWTRVLTICAVVRATKIVQPVTAALWVG